MQKLSKAGAQKHFSIQQNLGQPQQSLVTKTMIHIGTNRRYVVVFICETSRCSFATKFVLQTKSAKKYTNNSGYKEVIAIT